MKITINGTEVSIPPDDSSDKVFGINVRCLVHVQEINTYAMWRERKGNPDERIHDGTEIFEGDRIYFTPPCHGA